MGPDRYNSKPTAILMRCIAVNSLDVGWVCVLGSMLFRGHVRIYAPMRVAAQRGWGRILSLQILCVADIGGFRWQGPG